MTPGGQVSYAPEASLTENQFALRTTPGLRPGRMTSGGQVSGERKQIQVEQLVTKLRRELTELSEAREIDAMVATSENDGRAAKQEAHAAVEKADSIADAG